MLEQGFLENICGRSGVFSKEGLVSQDGQLHCGARLVLPRPKHSYDGRVIGPFSPERLVNPDATEVFCQPEMFL